MTNFITEGEVLEVTAGVGGIASGAPVLVGSVVGIAVSTVLEGAKTAVNTCGVYQVAKANVAITQGARLYWDAGNSNFTNVATGNIFAGIAYEAELQAATTVNIKLGCNGSSFAPATTLAAIKPTTDLTAIGGTFASLAEARTAVNTLATETEARLDAIETRLDALLTALKGANVIASA